MLIKLLPHFGLLVVLAFLSQICGAASLNDSEILKSLQAKYVPPFPSIYVTDATLNDLTVHLRETQKFSLLVNEGFSPETLNTFKQFLETVVQRGFLQVDLVNVKAGYKRPSDFTGVLVPLPWTTPQVIQVAFLCDRYLQGQLWKNNLAQQMKQGSITLAAAWTDLAKLQRDPFVPTVSLASTLREFDGLLEKNSPALGALEKQNPSMHKEIVAFHSSFQQSTVNPKDWLAATQDVWRTAGWKSDASALTSYLKATGKSTAYADTQAKEIWALRESMTNRSLDRLIQ